jgi:RNA polymerase sigma-70 factor (ECF subfamily)
MAEAAEGDVNRAYQAGRAAWPALALDAARFAAFTAARGLGAERVEAAAGDLYLACACLHGVPGALETFDRQILSRLPSLVARLGPTAEQLDELMQVLRAKLFTGAAPRIGEYSGRGSLVAWLRVAALRAAIDLLRAAARLPEALVDEEQLMASSATPEIEALRNRYRPRFAAAFKRAFALLTTDERNLIRFHFVDGLGLEQLAPLFQVARSTMFRRLHACTRALHEMMRAELAEELALSESEFDSLATLVKSDLDVSLSALLRNQT